MGLVTFARMRGAGAVSVGEWRASRRLQSELKPCPPCASCLRPARAGRGQMRSTTTPAIIVRCPGHSRGRIKAKRQVMPQAHVLSGTLGGLDGALLAGYFRGANVDIGNEYLLASIAVIVIGGTSVGGRQGQRPRPLGRGAVPGAAADRAQNLRRQRRRPPGADRAHHRRGHHRGRRDGSRTLSES